MLKKSQSAKQEIKGKTYTRHTIVNIKSIKKKNFKASLKIQTVYSQRKKTKSSPQTSQQQCQIQEENTVSLRR